MTRTRAIVFDMDGVLIDSEDLHAFSFLHGEEQ
jgi:beta-phosphoglucomutase-like phosphatase (HAD superfamily)